MMLCHYATAKVVLCLLFFLIFLPATSVGCAWFRPYHETPVEALSEFPGYIIVGKTALLGVLKEENVAGGVVLLYQFSSPPHDDPGYCLATTFLTQEASGGWRAQSASRLACGINYLESGEFKASYTIGGNITDLTTAYGVGSGDQARITWSDGQEDTVSLENGLFLKSRPDILHVKRIELLNEAGEILAIQTWEQQP